MLDLGFRGIEFRICRISCLGAWRFSIQGLPVLDLGPNLGLKV